MEYKPTNLPQYWRITPREDFANAVVQQGHVLIFSQNGETITAKTSDGSFVVIGQGSNSFSFSQVTATASDVLAGKLFYNSTGLLVQGTIQTVTAAVNANKITIPRGFIESDSITIPQGGPVTVQGNIVHIPSGYRAQSDSVSVAGGGASLRAGVVVSDSGVLYIQPLGFQGTVPHDSDSLQNFENLMIFNTGHEEPDYWIAQDSSLIFYAPLSSFQVAAKTGQGLQVNGTPSYSSYSGINSVLFSTSSTYLKTIVGIQSSAEVSISLWLYLSSQAGQSGGDYPRFLCLGNSSTADNASDWLCLTYNVSGQEFTFQAPDNNTWTTSAASVVKDQWVHLACVYSQGTLTLYVNGTAQTGATVVNALNLPTGSTLYINYINSQYNAGVDGSRMAALRVYNKALTTSQIQILANQFTPTA